MMFAREKKNRIVESVYFFWTKIIIKHNDRLPTLNWMDQFYQFLRGSEEIDNKVVNFWPLAVILKVRDIHDVCLPMERRRIELLNLCIYSEKNII